MTVPNHHEWPAHFANTIGESKNYAWETLCRCWAEHVVPERERTAFANTVLERFPGAPEETI